MRGDRWRAALWSVGLALLLAGTVQSVRVLRLHGQRSARVERKRREWAELLEMAEETDTIRRLRSSFEQDAGDAEGSLRDALVEIFGDAAGAELRVSAEPLTGGWSVQRAEITLGRIDPSAAARLIEEVERRLPPWRLTVFDIHADGGGQESSTVMLRFQRVTWAGNSPVSGEHAFRQGADSISRAC